jgi:acetyltransferase-like isoleucine patch superfamily enzyme
MKVGNGSHIYETAKIAQAMRSGQCEIEIGDDCLVGDFVFIALRKLTMKHGSQIAPHAILSGGGEVEMGEYSAVGFGAQLITGTDTPEGEFMCEAAPPERRLVIRGRIILEDGAYVGSGAIICVRHPWDHEIVIGRRSVVGAMSYIDKSVPPDMIVHPKQELTMRRRD